MPNIQNAPYIVKTTSLLRAGVTFCAAFLMLGSTVKAQNGLLREVYTSIFGGIPGLTNNANFPDNPAETSVIAEFETPQNAGSNYGQRVRGFIEAPETGNYTFWISSDDQSQLFLSSDLLPDNKVFLAQVPGATGSREWERYLEQRSAPVRLEAGKRYYIEALMTEGGGSDHLAVRWQLPSGTIEEPIPGNRLFVELISPQITRHPVSTTVTEGEPATFNVLLANRGPVSYQWLRGGQPLAGETNATLLLPATLFTDSGARFAVLVSNAFGTNTSNEATLTVRRDVTPPQAISAQTAADPTIVTVLFNERLLPSSATNVNNFFIDGATVTGASLDESGRTVILRTTPLTLGQSYILLINNVQDTANQPNPIEQDTLLEFAYSFRPLPLEVIYGNREPLGPSSRRTALVISEIMYNPPARPDGRNLEFIEIYNTSETLQSLGGYRLGGEVDYIFPEGTFLAGRSYLVVAPTPGDVQIVFGLPKVLGGFAATLPNDSGRIVLYNDQGAELLELEYSDRGEWPAAADGAGHSLVLARPSYGERQAKAWAASATPAGSPGRAEPALPSGFRTVVINEFLANTDNLQPDFIELYNYGETEVDLSGATLTDDDSTNKFTFAPGTRIAALSYLALDQGTLGFALSGAGERIILRSPVGNVIDAVQFDAQALGLPTGRFPDGNPRFQVLSAPTRGALNAEPYLSSIVINEIMYNPPQGSSAEYIELYNRSASGINLRGWRIEDGISYTFTQDAFIPANGYLVIASDIVALRTNHANLTAANSIGNFNGSLSNGGERIALARPEVLVSTNNNNQVLTNVLYVVVNEVTYGTDGRWPKLPDGGGSSLELLNAHANNNQPNNWAASDESQKSQWVTIERRGILSYASTNFAPTNPSRSLHVIMMDGGEVLLDEVQVIPEGGTNIVANPSFENGMGDWLIGGTHEDTTLETTEGFESSRSLHIRAVERGDTAANRIRAKLNQGLTNGMVATLRAKARWVSGHNELLLRLHGNYLEAEGILPIPANIGSPGLANGQVRPTLGPSITGTTHFPVLPASRQNITVAAEVTDPDRIALVMLKYRIDPSSNIVAVPMVYSGAGFYSAVIPGQPDGTNVAFHIEAVDSRGGKSLFPAEAPTREAVVGFGGARFNSNLASYRMFLTQKNINRWATREKSSNKPLDATFIYNDQRAVYNMQTMWSGSPFHWTGYTHPLGTATTRNSANYVMMFPEDNQFLGQTDFVLNLPSNLGSDGTGVREQVFFWMADQLNQPFNHRRYHHLFINGDDRGRGQAFEDSQQPNRDFVEQWVPNDDEGGLYKIEDWFEFGDTVSRPFFNNDAELTALRTTDLATGRQELKKERYRWWFRKRAVRDSAHDYSDLFRLVEAMNQVNQQEFVAQVEELIDVDEWMSVIALRHVAGDWDAFGYGRGKNMYAYKPEEGKWQLFHWDIAFAFGLGDGTTADLFATRDPVSERLLKTPQFQRSYYRALYEAANGPMLASRVNPVIDAKYNEQVSNGIAAASPESIKTWIANRRNTILSVLGSVTASFAITSNNGNNFSTNRNNLLLTGTAPVQVTTMRINGVEYPVTWTGLTTWETRYALARGQNTLVIEGLDSSGRIVSGASDIITVNYTGTPDQEAGRVVISEINFDPVVPGTEFVELHNSSLTTAFDLSGHELNGLSFTFGPGTVIQPGGFLVVAKNSVAFGELYGFTLPLAGEFSGSLDNGGETISLIRMDATGTNEVVITSVTYDDDLPWPTKAPETSGSLQLIDTRQDITRVGNWALQVGSATPNQTNNVRAVLAPFPLVWVNEVQPVNLSGPTDAAGDRDPWVELYNSSASAISLAGLYLTDTYTNLTKWAFPSTASIPAGARLLVWLDGEAAESTATQWHTSFRASPASGSIALVGQQNGSAVVFDYLNYNSLAADHSFGAYPEGQAQRREAFFYFTPGSANDPTRAPARILINEWMASNTSTIQDPDDLDFDDWIELYNAGDEAVDLGGYTLTDDLLSPRKFTFEQGTIIPAKGFLFMWADDERSTNGQVHVNFRLSNDGETLGLFAPNGSSIDSVTFGAQQADISEGRTTDGGTERSFFTSPTPGFTNAGAFLVGATKSGPSEISISWSSTAGKTYQVLFKASLTDPTWTPLTTITATGATSVFKEATTQSTRFYRVVEQP